MTDANVKKENGSIWNLTAEIGNAKQLSATFNMALGMTAADMNAEIDKVRSVFDRQQAKAASYGVEQEIEQRTMQRDYAKADLDRLDAENAQKGSMSAQLREQRKHAVEHVEKLTKDIEYKTEMLAKLKAEAK